MAPAQAARAFVAVGLLSCVFVTKSSDIGAHCAFSGRDSDCGKCLVARCQSEIDACCADSACGGVIGLVEACATNLDEACDAARSVANESRRQSLASCLKERCGGACANAPKSSSTVCADTKFGFGAACSCTAATALGGPANRFQCSPEAVPNTRCCAPPSWPSAGNACSCLTITCAPTSDGCNCFLTASYDPNAQSQRVCEGQYCCRGPQGCRCSAQPCTRSDETKVDRCDLTTLACPVGSQDVAQCSLP